MRAETVPVGSRLVDSLPYSQGGTLAPAQALRAAGFEGLIGYLGVMSPDRLGYVLTSGLGFLPVTLAGHCDGAAAVASCRALGLPLGVTVHLDLEGAGLTAPDTIARVNAWGDAVSGAGYNPALYVGVPQPLTSLELWELHVKGYWRGQGSIRDRANELAEPRCGWWAHQYWPSVTRGGVLVDVDCVGQDYHGRSPVWATA